MKTEQEEFLKDLEIKPAEDIFEKPIVETPEPEVVEKKDDEEESGRKAKNRRERRILEENQRLREEAIASTARWQAEKEAREALSSNSEEKDFLKTVEGIFGTEDPRNAAATELLKKSLLSAYQQAKTDSKEESRREREEERTKEAQEEQENSRKIDQMLEDIEEDFGADFSDPNTRNGFLAVLEKFSPKDKEGNIIEYADPEMTWEYYKSRQNSSSNQAKEIAGRSMVRSGGSQESKLQDNLMERFLKENGWE